MNKLKLAAFVGLAFSYCSHAASFVCTSASSRIEKIICTDDGLSKLDDETSSAYLAALVKSKNKISTRDEQRAWLRESDNCRNMACLRKSYLRRIVDLKSAPLTAFDYYQKESLPEQSGKAICKDFKYYINHPRSNFVFRRDGSLIRESHLIKSVSWENLNKDEYRASILARLKAYYKNSVFIINEVSLTIEQLYSSHEWFLQRTIAHPFEYPKKEGEPRRWVFRIVKLHPEIKSTDDLDEMLKYPAWFNLGDIALIGYSDGSPLSEDEYGLIRAIPREWIKYDGQTYAIVNRSYRDKSSQASAHQVLEVDALNVSPSNQTFMHYTCSFSSNGPFENWPAASDRVSAEHDSEGR